jgi:hypothetical protein
MQDKGRGVKKIGGNKSNTQPKQKNGDKCLQSYEERY